MHAFLRRFFEIDARGSTVGREARGAAATFLTMAYILFVNPVILKGAGVPHESAVACTALAAAVCCRLASAVHIPRAMPAALFAALSHMLMNGFFIKSSCQTGPTARPPRRFPRPIAVAPRLGRGARLRDNPL